MRVSRPGTNCPRTRQERYRLWTLVSISISGKHLRVQAAELKAQETCGGLSGSRWKSKEVRA